MTAQTPEPFPATADEFEGLAGLPLSDDVPEGWGLCAPDPDGERQADEEGRASQRHEGRPDEP